MDFGVPVCGSHGACGRLAGEKMSRRSALLMLAAAAMVARLAHGVGMDGHRVAYMVALAVTLSINGWLLGWYDSGR